MPLAAGSHPLGAETNAEEIANGIRVLGSIQAMRGHAARIRFRGRISALESALDIPGHRGEHGRARPLCTSGRHVSRAKPAKNRVPHIAMLRERLPAPCWGVLPHAPGVDPMLQARHLRVPVLVE